MWHRNRVFGFKIYVPSASALLELAAMPVIQFKGKTAVESFGDIRPMLVPFNLK
jgi:hypothetical protein